MAVLLLLTWTVLKDVLKQWGLQMARVDKASGQVLSDTPSICAIAAGCQPKMHVQKQMVQSPFMTRIAYILVSNTQSCTC